MKYKLCPTLHGYSHPRTIEMWQGDFEEEYIGISHYEGKEMIHLEPPSMAEKRGGNQVLLNWV